jgi:hypothetical protein
MNFLIVLAKGVVTAAIPVLTVLGTRYANKRWNLNLSAAQMQEMEKMATNAIMTSSQMYSKADKGEETNRKKMATAKSNLMANASKMGIKVTPELAEQHIEAAISKLKRQNAGQPVSN